MFEINHNPARREVRHAGLALLAGFGVIGLIAWRAGRLPETGWAWVGTGAQVAALAAWALGLLAGGACLAHEGAGRRVYVAWMTFGSALGRVVSTLLLTLMFFLFLPFFSLIRLKDPLRRRLSPGESYWEPHRPHEPTIERMARPF